MASNINLVMICLLGLLVCVVATRVPLDSNFSLGSLKKHSEESPDTPSESDKEKKAPAEEKKKSSPESPSESEEAPAKNKKKDSPPPSDSDEEAPEKNENKKGSPPPSDSGEEAPAQKKKNGSPAGKKGPPPSSPKEDPSAPVTPATPADPAPVPSGPIPKGGAEGFNVKTHGAVGDGKKDDTQAFMKTWVAACQSGGNARMVIPAGTFLTSQLTFTGPCKGRVVVEVLGTVKAHTDISGYPSPEWFNFEDIDGLEVSGSGTFDGQGPQVWALNDCKKNSDCQMLPTSLKFSHVTNGKLWGISSLNSMAFHIGINNCLNFEVSSVKITAPAESPNTDGVHISSSTNVVVTKSVIGTGDDCVSFGQGSFNVSITDIVCGPGHGISIGSLGKYEQEKDVSGITVRNCTLKDTDNGVRIKTYQGSGPSKATHMVFENIKLLNVKNPLIIDQLYCDRGCAKSPSKVAISDVHFRNIKGTSSSENAVSIICSSSVPCANVELTDIDIQMVSNKPTTSECTNAKVLFKGVQKPLTKCM